MPKVSISEGLFFFFLVLFHSPEKDSLVYDFLKYKVLAASVSGTRHGKALEALSFSMESFT